MPMEASKPQRDRLTFQKGLEDLEPDRIGKESRPIVSRSGDTGIIRVTIRITEFVSNSCVTRGIIDRVSIKWESPNLVDNRTWPIGGVCTP